ncbi:hypothetical protein FA95DRAFT_1507072, partial [Auriscalpium vulgare]
FLARSYTAKRVGCPCRLTVKTYPDTDTVRGMYCKDHSHATGSENVKFTHLSKATRDHIAEMLRMQIKPDQILHSLQGRDFTANSAIRDEFVTLADIRRIQKGIQAENIRLHPDDGMSARLWIERLRKRGIPVAWMLSSDGTEETVDYFIGLVKKRSPTVNPRIAMTDRDFAQINSIRRHYPEALILLCWWHVLHAWRQHFVVAHHERLWDRLQKWIRMVDEAEFEKCWREIQELAPPSVLEYLTTYWLPYREMWSAVFRKGRHIFQLSDTNMLVEA